MNYIKKQLDSLSEADFKDSYLVTLVDGRQHTYLGQDEIQIVYPGWKDGWRTLKVAEVSKYLEMPYMKSRLYMPLPSPKELPEQKYFIDPYLLGVLIGDGGLGYGRMTITSADEDLIQNCNSRIHFGFEVVKLSSKYGYGLRRNKVTGPKGKHNAYTDEIRRLGLNVNSEFKFIPENYLVGSIEQRSWLMKGLMDTDGTIDLQGTSSYCSTSYRLACDVVELARSLGHIAFISERHPSFTYLGVKKKGKTAYQVNLRVRNPRSLFSISRKLSRSPDKNQYSDTLKLRIEDIQRL